MDWGLRSLIVGGGASFGGFFHTWVPGCGLGWGKSRHGLFITRKNLPAMQETQVQLLGQEDPLEKEMASHSSTLAWRIPWMEEPGGLQTDRKSVV